MFYHDLRLNPNEINAIPEFRSEPALKALVARLNAHDGAFMTHGSALAHRKPEEHGTVIPLSLESDSAPHWSSSYITFSFWQFSLNTEERYRAIYEKYNPPGGIGLEVCFVIQPTYFCTRYEQNLSLKYGDVNATTCVLWVCGWGNSFSVAHSKWRNGLKSLEEFFAAFKLDDELVDPSALTVSHHMLNPNPNSQR